jgi:hypothetical protein
MDYAKITEAHGNLVKALKESGMEILVSKLRLRETGDKEVFIKIKASRAKLYQEKD